MTRPLKLRLVKPEAQEPSPKAIDVQFLEGLLGYNARRAALVAIDLFLERMAVFGLRPVDFSVLCIVHDNPGLTSRQICDALNLLPPNLVGLVASLEKRGLLRRSPHPTDKRALGLSLSAAGKKLMVAARKTVAELEAEVAGPLTLAERATLLRLLQKIYRPASPGVPRNG
jgi:DNA-binding MarR family transcriptional regulator